MSTTNVDPDTYEEIESSGVWDYDWSEVKLLRDKGTGQLYYAQTSGCSCYGFWDNVGADDFVPVKSWQDWAARAQEWAGPGPAEGEYDWNKDERSGVLQAIERLTQSRPTPSPNAPATQ